MADQVQRPSAVKRPYQPPVPAEDPPVNNDEDGADEDDDDNESENDEPAPKRVRGRASAFKCVRGGPAAANVV
ncbi:uncharacterized protein PpBr36_11303 [Pyricularia pennisetigena]|uniref:uncharacterized protein n=1 Tax=Pyricularia pennisetigena TaxID=1578925 RepID=UPI0011529A61|nr:uncharacterized protein PpBr36_11303 [Pyricularia pennisetigena]TLS20574.1 hypothetical protein PpBr36_11303 [Pyricularia pennisetigena]